MTSDRERLGALVAEIERLHTRLGTPDQAVRWVQRWVTAAPEEPEALRALARLYDRPGHERQLVAALDALDRLLVPAEQAVNRKRIAALYASLSHHEDAERAFARALEVDPGDPATLAGRAEALRALGRTDDLIPALERLADRAARRGAARDAARARADPRAARRCRGRDRGALPRRVRATAPARS